MSAARTVSNDQIVSSHLTSPLPLQRPGVVEVPRPKIAREPRSICEAADCAALIRPTGCPAARAS